jgi:hypothetical protein
VFCVVSVIVLLLVLVLSSCCSLWLHVCDDVTFECAVGCGLDFGLCGVRAALELGASLPVVSSSSTAALIDAMDCDRAATRKKKLKKARAALASLVALHPWLEPETSKHGEGSTVAPCTTAYLT